MTDQDSRRYRGQLLLFYDVDWNGKTAWIYAAGNVVALPVMALVAAGSAIGSGFQYLNEVAQERAAQRAESERQHSMGD